MAIEFIKKCATFADTIAFVLPLSFKKASIQKRIPKTYHLIKQIEIDYNSFTLNGQPYRVPCVFQIWKNQYENRLEPKSLKPKGFSYVNREESPDLAIRRVGVYAGKGYSDLKKSVQSHYFIKLHNADPHLVIEKLNKHKWLHENTVGARSISKPELNAVLNRIVR